MAAKRFRYFLYSRTQYTDRTKIESTIGMQYIPGRVLKNGKWREFTELSQEPKSTKYPDATVVTSGYLEDMKFEMEKRTRRSK